MVHNPALQYANDVISGKIPACKFVVNACKRFISDLDKYDFRIDKAKGAVRFIELFRHVKGEYAKRDIDNPFGKLFLLEPWQVFIVYNIFGFYIGDRRRFRKAYIEVPRKNGKTFLAAGIANYMLLADEEEGAEVYMAATKLDQARICYNASFDTIEVFVDEHGINVGEKQVDANNSVNNSRIIFEGKNRMMPLSSEFKKLDGLNPHCSIIDEYHEHPNDGLYNVLMNGSGSRSQPLLFAITTAGFNKESACYKHREYCEQVLSGALTDERLFSVIYTMDAEDEWVDESTWIKANPNYGVSIYPEFFEQQIHEARQSATKKVEFLTKLLNVWTDAAKTWIPDDIWMINTDSLPLEGICYGGLDLASVRDFCAFTLAFPHETGYKLFTRYYLCEETARDRKDNVGKEILGWADQGYICITPGNCTDYAFIKRDILNYMEQYDIKSIAYDRYNASQLVTELTDEGVNMIPMGQGFVSMNTPTKELERLAFEGKIWHNMNPVTRWQIRNVYIKRDAADSIKIDKEKSSEKVDGPVSIVMAIAEAMEAGRVTEEVWNESFTI